MSRLKRRVIPLAERLRFRPVAVLCMVTVWAVLWGSISPFVLVSGALLAWLIGVLFPLPPVFWQGRFSPIGFALLLGHLLWDLVTSSLRLVGLACERRINLNAGIVRIDLHTDNDLYQVAVAEIISLVPGTVVVEVVRQPRRLYLHAIDLRGSDPVRGVQQMALEVERRVLRAFGSKQERAAFAAACEASPLTDAPVLEEEQ